jgi:hypothetical protein
MNNMLDTSQFYAFLGNLSSDNDKANVTMSMNYNDVIGPEYTDRYQYDPNDLRMTDNGRTNVTVLNSKWTAGPYHCIVINNEKTKVLGVSQQFSFGPPKPFTIQVPTKTYYPGQSFYANVSYQNKSSLDGLFYYGDYLRIYKVQEDLSNNPLVLNNATFIGNANFQFVQYPFYRENYSVIESEIYWQTPGKYQIVLHSNYMQIVRGMSNVFEIGSIGRNRNTTITFNNVNNSIYPGQSVNVTIYKPDPPYGSKITAAFIRAKDSVNGTTNFLSLNPYGTWDSGTANLTVLASFNRLKWGWYKVVIMAGRVVIGVSKQFLVKRPYLQIRLPKRTFSRSDSFTLLADDIINPHFGFFSYDYHYTFEIVSVNYTMPDNIQSTHTSGGPNRFGYPIESEITFKSFSPGLYNIRVFVQRTWWYDNFEQHVLDDVVTIRNTTFRVN